MYKIINEAGQVYTQHTYTKEADFERMIVDHAKAIFGPDGIYFDIKKTDRNPQEGRNDPGWLFPGSNLPQ